MQLIFATNNPNKVKEIKKIVPQNIQVVSLKEACIDIEIPEPFDTFKENASTKTATIFNLKKENCFSEDTGLEVKALNGMPGVKSARYAGEPANDDNNIEKLLLNMQNQDNRTAQFKTIISLIWNEKEYWFEGICEGKILRERKGAQGFGYDPIFVPDGSNKSFAEMSIEEKSKFSHRKKAMAKLLAFLQTQAL